VGSDPLLVMNPRWPGLQAKDLSWVAGSCDVGHRVLGAHEKAPSSGGLRVLACLDGSGQYLFQPKGVACASEALAL